MNILSPFPYCYHLPLTFHLHRTIPRVLLIEFKIHHTWVNRILHNIINCPSPLHIERIRFLRVTIKVLLSTYLIIDFPHIFLFLILFPHNVIHHFHK